MQVNTISTHRRRPTRSLATRRLAGFSLVEVMVSMVILSIGLLGIGGLQAGVARYKVNSWARAALSGLYSDFADRVRMNTDVAGANFITGVPGASQYVLNSTWAAQQGSTPATPSPNCETAVCTTAERATYDMAVWRQLIRAKLPQGSALVSGDRRDSFQVTLMWFDKEMTDLGGNSDSQLVSSATCTTTMTGMARQSCCPAAASAPAGVRCANFTFIP